MNRRFSVKTALRILLLGTLFSLFLWGGYNRLHEAVALYREKEARDEELHILQEKDQSIRDELRKLGNLSVIEREAKERFNLKRPGETVIVIVPDTGLQGESAEPRESFFERIRSFVNSLF